MNFRFLITAAIAAVSISVFAQGRPGAAVGGQGKPGQGGQMRGGGMGMRRGMNDELKKQLNITAAQQKKLDAINAKYDPKIKPLRDAMRKKFEANKGKTFDFRNAPEFAKMSALFAARQKELDAVYTAKQKETMKKWFETHRGSFGRPGGPGRGGPGGPAKGGTTGGAAKAGSGGKTGH